MPPKPRPERPHGASARHVDPGADQTSSESDQTESDLDQNASDRDQEASESDQRASDLEQAAAAAERGADSGDDAGRIRALDEAQARHAEATLIRSAGSQVRLQVSHERDLQAARRDEQAQIRDATAAEHDRDADLADREAEELASEAGGAEAGFREALDASSRARARAASARARAADDRAHAARDREAAARDRELLHAEVERSQLDELTGAYRRGIGEVLLSHEIMRAQRSNNSMTLAFIDVDKLKLTNDKRGHAAGDSLLRCVFAALKARLRPYDTIIRWGGDEFLCAIPGATTDDAHNRIRDAGTDLGRLDPPVQVSFGFASLQAGETLPELVGRADARLLENRGDHRLRKRD